MIITFISDTHGKHNHITKLLPGGDLLIHAGDISSMGTPDELRYFLQWFNNLPYTHKVFIAGNHDFGFQNTPIYAEYLLENFPGITYLQDDLYIVGDDHETALKIWGSPWQPRFHNWAFNLDRGDDIKQKWDMIPMNTDILITHGPAFGYLDTVEGRRDTHLGCEELIKAIDRVKPRFHVCGHIHTGRGVVETEMTTFINASMLDERYVIAYNPITIDYNVETKTFEYK